MNDLECLEIEFTVEEMSAIERAANLHGHDIEDWAKEVLLAAAKEEDLL